MAATEGSYLHMWARRLEWGLDVEETFAPLTPWDPWQRALTCASIIQSRWRYYRLRQGLKNNPWHKVSTKGRKKSTHASHKKAVDRAAQRIKQEHCTVQVRNAFAALAL